ncbi:hypothetical protein SVAN01_05456 [Stagonosporopsis vannaccii]|nr:hypothetical protein SVAN01_05456 [Stagonosporopsis vannaccii]
MEASATGTTQYHVYSYLEHEYNMQLNYTRYWKHSRYGTRAFPSKWLLCLLLFCLMATPVAAQPDRANEFYGPITALAASVMLAGHQLVVFSGTLVGPSMGVSSVLWLVMRNDAAVKPKWSWTVFSLWSLLVLVYFTIQCRRVINQSLYILVTIATASLCMCMVALVQQSSLQSGLVTAVPPCTSFAAYAVAYSFPERRKADSWLSSA